MRDKCSQAADCYLLGPFSAYPHLHAPEPHLRFHAWQGLYGSAVSALCLALLWGGLALVNQRMEAAGLNNWDLHPGIFFLRLIVAGIALYGVPGLLFWGWWRVRALARRGGMTPLPGIGPLAVKKAGVPLPPRMLR